MNGTHVAVASCTNVYTQICLCNECMYLHETDTVIAYLVRDDVMKLTREISILAKRNEILYERNDFIYYLSFIIYIGTGIFLWIISFLEEHHFVLMNVIDPTSSPYLIQLVRIDHCLNENTYLKSLNQFESMN